MVPIPTRPDVCIILLLNVETPETTRLCAVKSVVVVIPKVLIPETLTSPRTSSFAVGFVVPIPTFASSVTTKTLPSVETPKVFATPIWNFCSGFVVPIPTVSKTTRFLVVVSPVTPKVAMVAIPITFRLVNSELVTLIPSP